MSGPGQGLVERVRSRCKEAPGGCLEWQGAACPKGYGRLRYKGVLYSPHRVALGAKLGRWLDRSEDTCHACDNPRCCNPEHLWAGSRGDNMRDAYAKGRPMGGPKTPEGSRRIAESNRRRATPTPQETP